MSTQNFGVAPGAGKPSRRMSCSLTMACSGARSYSASPRMNSTMSAASFAVAGRMVSMGKLSLGNLCRLYEALEDDARVSNALRHAFAIEPFEQRDGVLARDSGEVLELRDVEFVRGILIGRELLAQAGEGGLVEDEVMAQLPQD